MAGAEVIEIVIAWTITTALSFALVLADERLMSEERFERAWPPASRAAALVYFGLLAIPFHFARTRGSWKSPSGVGIRLLWFVLGLVLAAVVAIVSTLLITAIAWATGLPIKE
jgi:hypothetical protein